MLIKDIVGRTNRLLDGELLSPDSLKLHFDSTIDAINAKLNTVYPVFSELPVGAQEYTAFPDKYIRSVLCVGAAYHFYLMDEEGSPAAQAYGDMFANGLFVMLRDTLYNIPAIYQAPAEQGAVLMNLTGCEDNAFDMGTMRI